MSEHDLFRGLADITGISAGVLWAPLLRALTGHHHRLQHGFGLRNVMPVGSGDDDG